MRKQVLWLAVAATMAAPLVAAGPAQAVSGGGPTPQSWAQVDSMSSEMVEATTAQERLALTPQSALDAFPALQNVVMDGSAAALDSVIAQAGQAGSSPGGLFLGDSLPSCPSAGIELLPQFPAPYGLYAPNALNNWCMPNGEDDGCTVMPDSAFWFDFHAACRQHDMAYRFTPISNRFAIDLQFLSDALKDCRYRNAVGRALCAGTAAIYYAGIRAFGGFVFGDGTIPGYDTPGGPVTFAVPPCNQPTHVWVATTSATIAQGVPIYPTGVVRASSRALFTFTRNGVVVARQLTYFAGHNCVIRHERERLDMSLLPAGTIQVSATYVAWETNQTVTTPVTTLQIVPGPYTCLQPTHAWIAEGDAMTFTRGVQLHVTGVVYPYSPVTFQFFDTPGNLVASRTTAPAAGNCVVAHEPEVVSTAGFPLGYVSVDATYLEWETGSWVTKQIAILNIVAPPPPPPPPPTECEGRERNGVIIC